MTPKIFGVNYGNRFIPEKWMTPDFFDSETDDIFGADICLADISNFQTRMLEWLDKTITMVDFACLARRGINVLRVPCGYWNWVTYPGNTTPNCAFGDEDRLRNLQSLPPELYEPYFDKIFKYAKQFHLKILLDLHGLPGSQNGKAHSGVATDSPVLETDWNMGKSIEAVVCMARYCQNKTDSLYGIQIINEAENISHAWLDAYYKNAILAIRPFLSSHIPIVVFSWTYEFHTWESSHFSYDLYGNIVWDTHIYHNDKDHDKFDTLEDVKQNYVEDLVKLHDFHKRQDGGIMVGEWSLSGPAFDRRTTQELATWLVYQFTEHSHGSIFWNMDNTSNATWSFFKAQREFRISWKKIFKCVNMYIKNYETFQAIK